MPTFLSASWLNLVFANYPVDPGILEKYLPAGTEPDSCNGQAYVSLVGFLFTQTRLKGYSVPCHRTFEEINLRFYARRKTNEGWRRGVVFIREIVPRTMVTLIANRFFHEKYVTLPTRHDWLFTNELKKIRYECRHVGKWNSMSVTTATDEAKIEPGSPEEFLTRHFWGFTRVNQVQTVEYEVRHPDWKLHPVIDYDIDFDFGAIYGPDFRDLSDTKPLSVLAANGSPISVSDKTLLFVG